MRLKYKLESICIVLASALLLSCGRASSGPRVPLAEWEWASGQRIFAPLDNSQLDSLASLIPGGRGYVVLCTRFELPRELRETHDLGVYTGKICLAARISVNGVCIGTRGRLPPDEFCGGTGAAAYYIPENAIDRNGQNELEITVWTDGSGGIVSMPFVGSFRDADVAAKAESFVMSEIPFVFACIVLFITLFYLLLYFRWTKEKEYLWYALLNAVTALYLLPYYQGEVPWITLHMQWLMFNKLFLGVAAFVTAYFATSFIRTFLGRKDTVVMAVIRLLLLVIPIVWVMFIPDYRNFWNNLPVLFFFIGIQLLFAVIAVIDSLVCRQREIAILLGGFSPVLATVAVDLVVHGILRDNTKPFFTIYGWQGTIIFFLVLLIDRFTKMRRRVEYLNTELESEVEERTKALMDVNARLEADRHRAEQDMDLAVHVQRSFYQSQTDFPGWDIAVCFRPLSGISGDLYDFYQIDGKLRGFSLFDVSGHGIAAGLVTMLAKSVIYRTFKGNIGKRLSDILLDINKSVIAAKGNIENYLTGVLFRYDDATQVLEVINAGSPQPVFHKKDAADAQLLEPEKSEKQCGMIGISGLDVSFPSVAVEMKEGDCLICYTDGLTEAANGMNEQYGRQRLLKSFASAGNTTAAGNLQKILSDLSAFTGTTPPADDMTVIVLKRVQPAAETLEVLPSI